MNPPLPPELNIYIHSEAKNDFLYLENFALENIAIKLILKLARGSIRGQRLEDHPIIGDLSRCFKLYFDLTKDVPPRFRIVYVYIPNSHKPKTIAVLAVGYRESLQAYENAYARLQTPEMETLFNDED